MIDNVTAAADMARQHLDQMRAHVFTVTRFCFTVRAGVDTVRLGQFKFTDETGVRLALIESVIQNADGKQVVSGAIYSAPYAIDDLPEAEFLHAFKELQLD